MLERGEVMQDSLFLLKQSSGSSGEHIGEPPELAERHLVNRAYGFHYLGADQAKDVRIALQQVLAKKSAPANGVPAKQSLAAL